MLKNIFNITAVSCSVLFPSFILAEALAFKINGIGHRNTELIEVDLYDNGEPEYYTSTAGQVVKLDRDEGRLVSVGTLPAGTGVTGCAIGKIGSIRQDPLYLSGSPDANTAIGNRAGTLQLVNLTTGQTVGSTFSGEAPYSQLGEQIIGLGELSNSSNSIAYFAVSEERLANSTNMARVKIFSVWDSTTFVQPQLVESCSQFVFPKRGLLSAPHMTPIGDITGDGVRELLVVAPSCPTGACAHVHQTQVINPVTCGILHQYSHNLPNVNPYGTISSIEHLGDFYSNGKQHVALAVSGSGSQYQGGVQILEIASSGAVTVVHTIPAPDQTFGFSMAYNGETLAISSPYTDYYPNINTEEGAIHLIDRGTHNIREAFGGGRQRENKIGGNLQWIVRDGVPLLVSTSMNFYPKMDVFFTEGDSLALSRTACADFQQNLNPQIEIHVDYSDTSIDFTITGLNPSPDAKSFLYIDGVNPYLSSPFFTNFGQSCNTTMRFQYAVSSPELSVNSRGEASFSIPYIRGTIPHWNERGLTAAVATFLLPQNGNISFSSSSELHFTLP